MMKLQEVEAMAEKFNMDVEAISKEIKKVQSQKCRLKKFKGKSSYEEDMTKILQYEEILKEAKALLEPREKPVTQYEQADVDRLDYDETVKAIKSIQSKKTNTQWLTTVQYDNDEYRNAVRIEKMLIEHRSEVKPYDDEKYIRKTDLQMVIDTIENSGELSKQEILRLLNDLM